MLRVLLMHIVKLKVTVMRRRFGFLINWHQLVLSHRENQGQNWISLKIMSKIVEMIVGQDWMHLMPVMCLMLHIPILGLPMWKIPIMKWVDLEILMLPFSRRFLVSRMEGLEIWGLHREMLWWSLRTE